MIEKFLRSQNYRFLRDNDDDFVLQFGYDKDTDCKLSFNLMVSGKANDIYSILARSDKNVSRQEWGRVIMLCNTWNREKRWPKAYLYVQDPDSSPYGEIFLEQHFNLEQGIHQELFNDFTSNMIVVSNLFWEWIHNEHGI
jgi:hypothetical protein